jgi:glycosyltransferase involved in cell wall biosynthesis
MNIAFLSLYSGTVNRGVETYVSELSKRLIKYGHSVRIYTSSSPVFDPIPDIVIPTNGRLQAIRTRLWTLLHHKICLISGQSGLGADDKLNLLTFPDAFIGLTNYQCHWAKAFNPFVKVIRIPNGVDLNEFHPRLQPLNLHIKPPVVLYVAALEPIKRHSLLIDAIAQTPASLLLVGSGSLKDQITSHCETMIPGRYQILSVPHSHMPRVYNSAQVLAYPTSPWESFGISILEAMACNLPIIATHDPIRKEIVGEAGILVNPENTSEFAKAITTALKKAWGKVPRDQAQKFSWDVIAQHYHTLFTSHSRHL